MTVPEMVLTAEPCGYGALAVLYRSPLVPWMVCAGGEAMRFVSSAALVEVMPGGNERRRGHSLSMNKVY